MMTKFRRKPVIVEAEPYEPNNAEQHARLGLRFDEALQKHVIETLEGDIQVSRGDWIVIGVHGERYPCKPDIFEETYERSE